MQLHDLKEMMRTMLFQIAALDRSKSDPQNSYVSPKSTSTYCFASHFAVIDSIGSQE